MKKLQEMQAEYTKVICVQCEKAVSNYYGRYGKTGVCSKTCMKLFESKPIKERKNEFTDYVQFGRSQ